MNESFDRQLEIAKEFFEQGLPYWCDYFSRPTDQEFEKYLIDKGYDVKYLVMEIFDPVYIPKSCSIDDVSNTAKERKRLRDGGVSDSDLPVLL